MQARCSVLLLAALMVVAVRAASAGYVPGAQCPAGYTGLGLGMCVKVHSLVELSDGRLPWADTNELCKADGGRLISLDQPAKLERLSAYIHETLENLAANSLWVGATKDATGWKWLNSAPLSILSNMWYPTEPKDETTHIYAQIIPFSQFKRHYIRSTAADAIAPGYVCEALASSVH